ncbi:MAG: hypothetical protein JRH16_14030 [Deltaproteobacteria bacterium]|nr:hypothetical protein [Deltaproteobacteria bacterium]MBW2359759.1 hypothetical protein [Deltaproteobacteria bacterium]
MRLPRRDLGLALGLAGLAALRVWTFAFAFPFFTNVDEYRHVDAVLKYARGAPPALAAAPYELETARLLGVAGSPEYHRDPVAPMRAEVPPPVWRGRPEEARARIAEMEDLLRPLHSLEAGQPPVYYATAGAWLALGRALGLRDAALLYWVRLLGGVAAFVLVLTCWAVLRALYPDRPLMRWGVPLLLAAMPQDALYYVTGDAFSPLLGGLGFLGVASLLVRRDAQLVRYVAVGLVLAAGLLCKYPNAALYVPALVATGFALAAGGSPASRRGWLGLWTAALLPPLLWFARNLAAGAGLTGTAFKAEKLGWTLKPLGEWLGHPLFGLDGLGVFLRDLVTSFWRGELVWHQRTLASGLADGVYLVFSVAALALAAVALGRRRAASPAAAVEVAAALALLAGVSVLALLSLAFVFEGTVHPSLEYPYFANGRLIGGVLVPFCLLAVRGVECGSEFFPESLRQPLAWSVLGGVVVVAFVSEVALGAPVFTSAYNAYHLQ